MLLGKVQQKLKWEKTIMQILSDNPQLLDKIYHDFERKNIDSKRGSKKIDGAMGDVTVYISLAALGMQAIDVLINYLSYRQSQKNNFVHFKYKEEYNGGIEVKLENLTKDELGAKKEKLRDDINNNKFDYINIG